MAVNGGAEGSARRIAELKRLAPEAAAAYVASIGRQIDDADFERVAGAIVQLLVQGKPFKAKDVARYLKGAPSGAVPPVPVPIPAAAAPHTAQPAPDDDEVPAPAAQPDAETRRDTRYRFEQWAKNQKCEANVLSAVHGVRMADVARAEGLEPTMGQSPFALARGQMFEGRLFKNGAERLIPELARHGVLPTAAAAFRDLRLRQHGGPCRTLDEAKAATAKLLTAAATDAPGPKPLLVAGATISIPGGGMLPEAILVVDILVVRSDVTPPRLVVGEVKTYPDRGGYTDAKELAVARAQAGVYVQGLRRVLGELKLAERVEVSTTGFLVLSRPGSNTPSVRAGEDLEFQATRAERGFEKLRAAAAALPPRGGDLVRTIRKAETAYAEACVSFCDRAPTCWQKTLDADDPAILGDDVARWLGDIKLRRALELLDGKKPATAAERELAKRLREARLPDLVE